MASDEDYRSFIFATHQDYGMLLLFCTRKKKKGPHYQVPGGHVDKEDFDTASSSDTDRNNDSAAHILQGCKIGAARELFEETGLDVRNSLERLQPVWLRVCTLPESNELSCELKKRIFFKLDLFDDDFFPKKGDSEIMTRLCVRPINNIPSHLMLKMSHEHQGFIFEPNPKRCVEYLTQHSGGKISTALRMAIEQGQIECPESASSLSSDSGEEKGASERSSAKVAVVNESEKTKRRWGNIFHWCDC